MKFGILSDILGQRDDIPSIKLPAAYACGESEWMYYQHGVMRRLPGRRAEFLDANGDPVPIPDANPIIHWHYHVSPGGAEFVHAFTKAHVYRWDGGTKSWDLLWTCASDCVRWSTADFGPYVGATNNVDKVLQWDDTTPATDYIVMDDLTNGLDCGDGIYVTKAQEIIECEGYLFVMGTTENGTSRRYRRRWCSWGDLGDWDSSATKTGDAGYNDLEHNRRINGCGILSAGGVTRLVTFTQNLIDMMWLTESDLVWESEGISQQPGCAAAQSIVNDADGNLYYLATDHTIRTVGGTTISGDIGRTIRNLHPQLLKYTQAAYVNALHQIWWAVPSHPDAAGNDLVLIYNVDAGTWHKAPMDICAFGGWTGQTNYSIDTIPFPTIEGIEWPFIDWAGQVEEYPFLIASDYSGLAYRCIDSPTDKGAAYQGKLALATDLADRKAVTEFKRVHGLWLFFDGASIAGDTATVSIEVDGGANFETIGTVAIPERPGRVWLPADIRFQTCKLKVEAGNPFDFVGAVFDYDWDGDA